METNDFGAYIRKLREEKSEKNKQFSLRQVATRLGVQPSYLSKVERGEEPNPSESFIKKLALELEQDENVLLAMVGKVSQELRDIIVKNPAVFAQLITSLKDSPEHAILRLVREVKDGTW